jgi:hypothetical protein
MRRVLSITASGTRLLLLLLLLLYSVVRIVGWFGVRIRVWARFSALVQTGTGPPSFLYKGCRVSFRENKAAGVWLLPPTPICLRG